MAKYATTELRIHCRCDKIIPLRVMHIQRIHEKACNFLCPNCNTIAVMFRGHEIRDTEHGVAVYNKEKHNTEVYRDADGQFEMASVEARVGRQVHG